MSPVESRVLTRLSPSVPPGRGSALTVIEGLALWKALTRSLANVVLAGSLPAASSEMVVAPPDPPDELQPARAAPMSATPPRVAATRVAVLRENIKYLLVF